MRELQVCIRCVMDTTAEEITFDENWSGIRRRRYGI